eukprot:237959_1
MVSLEELSTELNTIEVHRTLHLSSIVDKLGDIAEDEQIITKEFNVDNLSACIVFVPKISEEKGKPAVADDEYCTVYLQLDSVSADDSRIIKFSVACGDDERSRSDSIQVYEVSNTGWSRLCTHTELKKYQKIYVSICMYPKSYHEPKTAFEDQLQKMYDISTESGDTKLIVKIENENELYSPPRKKRKLNISFQCEVCDQPFGTQRGLKSHQSKKMDDTHKDFRNKKNNTNINIKNNDKKEEKSLDDDIDQDEEHVLACSSILRSASVVFDRMLQTNMKEKQENKIVVNAKNISDVEDLVHFMCTNKLSLYANALNLVHMAHYYEMDRLFWQCAKRLVDNISMKNYVETVKIFDKYEIQNGYQTVIDFGKKNLKELQKRDDFLQLSHLFRCIVLNVGK